MRVLTLIILIISFIASTKIVNGAYSMYMKVLGASAMRYNGGKKLIAIIVVTLIIMGTIINVLGISVPQ